MLNSMSSSPGGGRKCNGRGIPSGSLFVHFANVSDVTSVSESLSSDDMSSSESLVAPPDVEPSMEGAPPRFSFQAWQKSSSESAASESESYAKKNCVQTRVNIGHFVNVNKLVGCGHLKVLCTDMETALGIRGYKLSRIDVEA